MHRSYLKPYVALIYVKAKTRAKQVGVNSFPFLSLFAVVLPHLGKAEKGSKEEYLSKYLSEAMERKETITCWNDEILGKGLEKRRNTYLCTKLSLTIFELFLKPLF